MFELNFNNTLIRMGLFAVGYMFLSIVIAFITYTGLSIWMGINVGFAIIPLIVITFTLDRLKTSDFSFDWITIFLLLVYIFFLPNTFYIITDFIHLDSSSFEYMSQGETVYLQRIEEYVLLFHIVFSMLIGIYAGVESLLKFEEIVASKVKKVSKVRFLMVSLLFLSSIGIFIGRFLRLFSWDMLNPFKVIKMLVESMNGFGIAFILLFTIVQCIIYYVYKSLFKK